MTTLSMPVPNGLLFLYDRARGDIRIPDCRPGEIVCKTETAASIAVQPEGDGPVSIDLLPAGELMKDTKPIVSIGEIAIEGGEASLFLTAADPIASIPSRAGRCRVVITADRRPLPAAISIYVEQPA